MDCRRAAAERRAEPPRPHRTPRATPRGHTHAYVLALRSATATQTSHTQYTTVTSLGLPTPTIHIHYVYLQLDSGRVAVVRGLCAASACPRTRTRAVRCVVSATRQSSDVASAGLCARARACAGVAEYFYKNAGTHRYTQRLLVRATGGRALRPAAPAPLNTQQLAI